MKIEIPESSRPGIVNFLFEVNPDSSSESTASDMMSLPSGAVLKSIPFFFALVLSILIAPFGKGLDAESTIKSRRITVSPN